MNPIVVEFEVDAPVDHAFKVWTEMCALWWPRSHSMSESDEFSVIFEPFPGGRVYERGADGAEHDWGEVIAWEPPHRLEYWWHIFLDRDRATVVTLSFTPVEAGTNVRLENSGFDVFGDGATERIGRVESVWTALTESYRSSVAVSG